MLGKGRQERPIDVELTDTGRGPLLGYWILVLDQEKVSRRGAPKGTLVQ